MVKGRRTTSGLSVCLWPGMYGMGVFVFEQNASFQASVWLYLRFKGFQFPARRFRCFSPVFQEGIETHSTSDEINRGPKCFVKESSFHWERQGRGGGSGLCWPSSCSSVMQCCIFLAEGGTLLHLVLMLFLLHSCVALLYGPWKGTASHLIQLFLDSTHSLTHQLWGILT